MGFKKPGLTIGLIIAIIIVIAGGLYAWLSYGPTTDLKIKAFQALPYPAAFVDGKPILAREILHRLDIAKKSLPSDSGITDEEIKQQVYEKIVAEKKADILAGEKGVDVSETEVNDQYKDAVEQLTEGNNDKFLEMLNKYGLSEREFKTRVLKPDMLVTKLIVWYNGNRELNGAAFSRLAEAQKQIAEGKPFEEIALAMSQDLQSQGMDGDLGFVEIDKLLPEFKQSLAGARAGDTPIVASRYGLHLFKVEQVENSGQNGENRMHLRQIFIESSGFDNWYEGETKNFTVKKIIKI